MVRNVFPSPPPLETHRRRDAGFELPIPDASIVPTYAIDVAVRPIPFINPLGYIRRSGKGPLCEAEDYIEYDLEFEDIEWLRLNARMGEAADPSMRLGAATFEFLVDALEKANGALPGSETMPSSEAVMAAAITRETAKAPLPAGISLGTAVWRAVAQDMFAFWTGKRKRLGKPLLRRFGPVTSSCMSWWN